MEEQCNDPYEQQLFAVFESCLVDGQTDLKYEGLTALCEKLQLDQSGKDMILSLLHKDTAKKSISFRDFRNGLLELLDKSQEKASCHPEKDHQIISDNDAKQNSYRSKINDNMIKTMKYQRQQLGEYIHDRIFNGQKIDEFWNNDHATNNTNGVEDFPVYRYTKVSAMAEQENSHSDELKSTWSGNLQSDIVKRDGKFNHTNCETQYASCMQSNSIVNMWELAGIQDASTLLSDLGFEMPHINTSDLINVLLDELKSHHDEPHDKVIATHIKLLKCTLCLFQEQNRYLASLMEHLTFERDKLRADVQEANDRANNFAQEIDEHHTRMEKCRQEQLKQLESKHTEITKELMNQLNMEREKNANTIQMLDKQLQNSQQEEQRFKSELANISRESRELESENQMLLNEISKLKSFNDQLSMQIESLAVHHHDQIRNTESDDSEQIADLLNHIKHLKSEIAILRDHNDELTTELEYHKRNDKESKNAREKSSLSSIVQKSFSAEHEEENCSFANDVENVNSVDKESEQTKNMAEIIDEQTSYDVKLKNIRTIIVETVQQLRCLLKQQQSCSDHCALRLELTTIISSLESHLPFVKDQSDVTSDVHNLSGKIDYLRISSNACQMDESKSTQRNKNTGLRDYPPRKEEQITTSNNKSDFTKSLIQFVFEKGKETEIANERIVDLKSIDEFLRERESELMNEKKQLQDRCSELLQSVDLLKMEYEQCEDYWTAKLEEEREIFEQEQKISDEKFAELINKMTEYEEQFNTSDKSRSEGRLTPIEEKINLEQQYADLEEELENCKSQMQQELQVKNREIIELKEKLLQNQVERTDVGLQCPEESTSVSIQESSTSHAYHSLDSAATFDDLSSPRNSVDSKYELDIPKKKCNGARSRVPRLSASSVDCSNQIETDILLDDVRWMIQKKTEIGFECKALQKEKEKLRQEVTKLQNLKQMNDFRMMNNVMAPPMVDVATMQSLYLRLHAQEQKQKDLMACIRHQQQDTMRLLQQTWKQHHSEISDLKAIIHNSKEKLEQQILINKEQDERLAKADQLTKELYMENTQLLESIKRLEQHCHILSQCNTECTSV